MRSIFEYTNYREFLNDYYKEQKEKTRYFTYRYFSEKAGFKSPNQLQLIIQGKRNLTESALFRVAEVLKLNSAEMDYFRDLVGFGQAKSVEDKNFYYQKLLTNKKSPNIRELEREQFEFLTNWYHAVVRELIACTGFSGDFEAMAKQAWPQLTAAQVRKSVKLLEKFNLIKKNEDGTYSQTSGGVTIGPEVRDVALVKYHTGLLEISKRVLKELDYSEFNISSVTVGVSEETYRTMRDELDRFRKRILNLAAEDKKPERVYQMNLQLFPFSQKGKES